MSARRRIAGVASTVLLALLVVASTRPAEISRRVRRLFGDARADLAVRRLHGTSAAFDRRFFSFLENVRRRLPASTAGVVFRGAPPTDAYRFVATYQLSPVPVLFEPGSSGDTAPPGWLLATYGTGAPPGRRVVASFPEGFLCE
jgi:hypothetical protein